MSETTYLEEEGVCVCNNCGAHVTSLDDRVKATIAKLKQDGRIPMDSPTSEELLATHIDHHSTCKKGEAKKWEQFYEENPEDDDVPY